MFPLSLVSLAEYSHLFSLASILLTTGVMFTFIARIIGQDFLRPTGGVTTVDQLPAVKLQVTKAALPVSVALKTAATSSGVQMGFTTEGDDGAVVNVRLYSGVAIKAFHNALQAPWEWFRENFKEGNIFGAEGCHNQSTVKELCLSREGGETISSLSCPGEPLDLGPSPRQRYPYVVVTLTDSYALLHVVHVQDEVCRIPTQVLFFHVKPHDGGSYLMQPLFVSEEEDDGRAVCVVCQELAVTRAILPCKHASTCRRCFPRLRQRCPMCRGWISSFFVMEEEPESETEVDDGRGVGVGVTVPWRERLGHWNHAFAMYMGLEEN